VDCFENIGGENQHSSQRQFGIDTHIGEEKTGQQKGKEHTHDDAQQKNPYPQSRQQIIHPLTRKKLNNDYNQLSSCAPFLHNLSEVS
jgi:hypothetical protein